MVWEQKVLFTFIIVELFIIIFKIERGIEDRAESDFFPFQRHFNIHDGYVVNYSIKRPVQESNPQHSKQGPVATGPDLYIGREKSSPIPLQPSWRISRPWSYHLWWIRTLQVHIQSRREQACLNCGMDIWTAPDGFGQWSALKIR